MKTLLILITLILPGCATNEHDAAIAESAASIERTKEDSYAKGIAAANQPKLLVEIKGEVVCTEDQKLSDNCGISFYNPNARSVMPQRDKNWIDGVTQYGGAGVVVDYEIGVSSGGDINVVVATGSSGASHTIGNLVVSGGNQHNEHRGKVFDAGVIQPVNGTTVLKNPDTQSGYQILSSYVTLKFLIEEVVV